MLQLIEVDLKAIGLVRCNHQLLEVAIARALSRDCCETQRIHCGKNRYREKINYHVQGSVRVAIGCMDEQSNFYAEGYQEK